MEILTDRTRIELDARCSRLRYWNIEFQGVGLDLDKNATALAIGSCVHEGISQILLAQSGSGANPVAASELLAYGLAQARTIPELDLLTDPDDRDLVDALVRTWWFGILPQLQNWEVLDVEREEVFNHDVPWCEACHAATSTVFGDWNKQDLYCAQCGERNSTTPRKVKMMSRLDLLARAKDGATLNGLPIQAGGIFQFDCKTAAQIDKMFALSFLYDNQPLTQLLGVEQRLGEKLSGFVAGGLVKSNHPLVWCWQSTKTEEVRSRFKWHCEAPHQNIHTKAKDWCLGDRNHTLGGDFQPVAVRDLEGGQAAWFEKLTQEEPDLLREFARIEGPFARRSEYEVSEWCDSNLPREVEIASVRSSEPLDEATLRRVFPKKTANRNCLSFAKLDTSGKLIKACPAINMCWGADSPENYELRVPNHQLEKDILKVPVGSG